MAIIANEYCVYYETSTKILQGRGLWGEIGGIPDSDGVSRYKGFNVAFATCVTTFFTDDYATALTYIQENELIYPHEE